LNLFQTGQLFLKLVALYLVREGKILPMQVTKTWL